MDRLMITGQPTGSPVGADEIGLMNILRNSAEKGKKSVPWINRGDPV
jgi:hypothetical protein